MSLRVQEGDRGLAELPSRKGAKRGRTENVKGCGFFLLILEGLEVRLGVSHGGQSGPHLSLSAAAF